MSGNLTGFNWFGKLLKNSMWERKPNNSQDKKTSDRVTRRNSNSHWEIPVCGKLGMKSFKDLGGVFVLPKSSKNQMKSKVKKAQHERKTGFVLGQIRQMERAAAGEANRWMMGKIPWEHHNKGCLNVTETETDTHVSDTGAVFSKAVQNHAATCWLVDIQGGLSEKPNRPLPLCLLFNPTS